jgi:hypothetical protein
MSLKGVEGANSHFMCELMVCIGGEGVYDIGLVLDGHVEIDVDLRMRCM